MALVFGTLRLGVFWYLAAMEWNRTQERGNIVLLIGTLPDVVCIPISSPITIRTALFLSLVIMINSAIVAALVVWACEGLSRARRARVGLPREGPSQD